MAKYLKASATSKSVAGINTDDALARLLHDDIKPHDAVRNAIAHALKHGTSSPLRVVEVYLTRKQSTKAPKWVDGAAHVVKLLLADFEVAKTVTAICRKNHISMAQVVQLVEVLIKADSKTREVALSNPAEIAKVLPEVEPVPAAVKPKKETTKKMVDLSSEEAIDKALAEIAAKRAALRATNPAQLSFI